MYYIIPHYDFELGFFYYFLRICTNIFKLSQEQGEPHTIKLLLR